MNLKIFVSYKGKREILKNDIITPIQTGRAISDEIFEEMIGDDTGDNISCENPKYCELTAQYWVWKHYEEIGNPEYIGFMHNRRQFIFDKDMKHLPYTWLPKSEFYFLDNIPNDFLKHFTEDKILPYINIKPDCILFPKVNIRPVTYQPNMKKHFYLGLPHQKEEVFNVLKSVINDSYHEYFQTFEEFENNTFMYCCNSFIMPKKLFFEYCEFLFGVLEKIDKEVDSTLFDCKEMRFLGFIGEYLLSVFVMQNQKNPNFKTIEIPATFVSQDYKKFKKKVIQYKIYSILSFGKAKIRNLKKYINYKNRMRV